MKIKNDIETVAIGLGPLLKEVIFVGGSLPVFYVADSFVADARPTEDIDCIVQIVSQVVLFEFENQLRGRGFINEPSMIARWHFNGLTVDIMPTDESVLGFSNSWYKHAFNYPQSVMLPNGTTCSILSLAYFLATKFEAMANRGGDLRMSKDLEDIIFVVNGCETITEHIKNSPADVRGYLQNRCSELLANPYFEELVEASLAPAMILRVALIKRRLKELERLKQ